MNAKKTLPAIFIIVVVIILVIATLFFGMSLGRDEGEKDAEEKFSLLIDKAYPRPAAELNTIGGIITEVRGGIIGLEVADPDDYLPHLDGSPQKKEFRFVSVSSDTEIVTIDYTRPTANGNPTITPMSISDLKAGDEITVTSESNIRDAKKFDVYKVEIIYY